MAFWSGQYMQASKVKKVRKYTLVGGIDFLDLIDARLNRLSIEKTDLFVSNHTFVGDQKEIQLVIKPLDKDKL